jgi:hypothetical protein
MEGLKTKYFVLNPEKRGPYGRASRKAMLAYADAIKKANPALSYDLQDWVERVSGEAAQKEPK